MTAHEIGDGPCPACGVHHGEYMERMRQASEAGDIEGLFWALDHCFHFDPPLEPPAWVKQTFIGEWRRYANFEVAEFGARHKQRHVASVRIKERYARLVWSFIAHWRRENKGDSFQAAADELGIDRERAIKLYHHFRKARGLKAK